MFASLGLVTVNSTAFTGGLVWVLTIYLLLYVFAFALFLGKSVFKISDILKRIICG
jgi:hypothetical protein